MGRLDRTVVVDAAMTILDDYGLADVTMRRLAGMLEVAPGALYWHFPNKQTLLGAMADRILSPADRPVDDIVWDEQLGVLAHRMRKALLAHRDGAEVVSATYASRLTTSSVSQRMAEAALQAGMSRHEAELTGYTVLHFVLGHTTDEQARMYLDSAGALPEHFSPLFENPDAATRFDFGLRVLLDGLRYRYPQSPTRGTEPVCRPGVVEPPRSGSTKSGPADAAHTFGNGTDNVDSGESR